MKTTKYYSLGEVSKLLDISFYRITYAHTKGGKNAVQEPGRHAGKRAYRNRDVLSLAKHFNLNSHLIRRRLKGEA